MTGEELTERLRAIEERLARLEELVRGPELRGPTTGAGPAREGARPAMTEPALAPPSLSAKEGPREGAGASTSSAMRPRSPDATVTNVLGWSGALALVLAAAYLIRQAITAGWLTPTIQVGGAALVGSILIAAGIGLRRARDDYFGLLPAAGIAILFLSVYGAHLLYHLIDARAALGAVVVISAVSLALCAILDSTLYALFAVAGSYSAPFLIKAQAGSLADLALYFSAWSITFTIFGIARGKRLVYLLALYVALVGFDAVARAQAIDWHLILAFQTAQFVIFGLGTLLFSIRWSAPLDDRGAMVHLPALLLFYALQYAVLNAHAPAAAPWVAFGSLLAVALLYGVARWALGRRSRGGELLLGLYAALVLFHAGYVQSVPSPFAPWVALALGIILLMPRPKWLSDGYGAWPVLIGMAAIFTLNLYRLFVGLQVERVPAHQVLGFLYALLLYLGHFLARREPKIGRVASVLLFAGHLIAMSAVVQLVREPILQSVAWGLIGLAALLGSLVWRDPLLGKSSLLLFGATGLKVVLLDLEGAAPLARIFSLAVLGVTFYVGGLLYRRVARLETGKAPER